MTRALQKLAALVVASVVVCSFAREARAFCRSTTCDARTDDCGYDDEGCKTVGLPLAWPSSCVGFAYAARRTALIDSAALDRVLDASLRTWSLLPCGGARASLSLARRPDVACGVGRDPSGPNANVIVFRDDGWPHAGASNTLAFTTVTFDVATGEIFDADIEVNTAQNVFTTTDTDVRYDLESVLTHELGHAVGLAHASDAAATMNASYDKGSIAFRTLSSDDTAAVCAAYPPDRAVPCNLNGRGGFDTCRPPEAPRGGGGCVVGPPVRDEIGAGLVVLVGLAWRRVARRSVPRGARRSRSC